MKVEYKKLKEIVIEILKGIGEEEHQAKLAADSLVKADMRNISTHGTYLILPLKERVEAGMLTVPTNVEIINEDKGNVNMDGGNGIGQVGARKAMEKSIEKAKSNGISLTLLRNTNNVGFLGYYTNLAADNGLIGFAGCNAAPAMAPWGGAEQFFGTNPLSFAVPTKNAYPIILDMSSSIVARGKIRRAKRNNEKIPEGWALDSEGKPTTDPEEALNGSVLPIAGPKGSGLAMIVDILAGILSGSSYAPNLKSFHSLEGATGVGFFCGAIDIESFKELNSFYSIIDEYIKNIKNMKKAENVDEVYLPGEIELINQEKSIKEGVTLDRKVVEGLNKVLKQLDLDLKI